MLPWSAQAYVTRDDTSAGGSMDDKRHLVRYDPGNDPARVLALSDGVFAIVLTLLVLEIQVPDLAGGQSLEVALREVRPSFVAFLISFLVVAIAWAGHRDLFALIGRTDRVLVWLNILYLLPLSILPFGASLIARYGQEPVALEMYGILLFAIALTRLVIWWYATGRSHLLVVPVSARFRREGVVIVAAPAVINALAVVIAADHPAVSLVIYAAVPVLYFVAVTLARSAAPPGSAEQDLT
jgi:uncharacterized membrane protein